MSITISREELNHLSNVYHVNFFGHKIEATVTADASVVTNWINRIKFIHRRRLNHLVVGLDTEWRPSFSSHIPPVATIQLCVGRICLIFQILIAQAIRQAIPRSLRDFLWDQDYTFVGVGVSEDARKLDNDYGLDVQNMVDLRDLAASRWGRTDVKSMGLAKLASMAMGIEINKKPQSVTMSNWDNASLTLAQIAYGCIDAFMSFETGRILDAYQDSSMARGTSQSQSSTSSSSASRQGVVDPPCSSAAITGMCRRCTTGSSSSSDSSGSASGDGPGASNMLRFYTNDSPGLKISPTVILVMSLCFIGFITALYVMFGKFYRSKAGAAAA